MRQTTEIIGINQNEIVGDTMRLKKQGKYIKAITGRHTLTFSLGNKKLSDSILIWNLPAGKKGSCDRNCKGCYAIKIEKLRPSVLISRNRNFDAMKDDPTLLTQAIDMIIKKYGHLIEAIRFHESGDIFNSAYAQAIENTAKIAVDNGINPYTYTKTDYRPDGLNIVESVMPDGRLNYGKKEEVIDMARKYRAKVCPYGKGRAGKNIVCGRECKACTKYKHVVFIQH